ncbi:DUF4037 domain-containing protein [Brachybacterium hainanense]|uniref:DUF4037 domain-containing protein n=1 Tax=Brachybacterium hainanense TaxID=1541174 RepID=A0ABV6RC05_9MICO
MSEDTAGLDLARSLYREVIAPQLDLPHAACLIGEGSEVLSFDDARSRDHEWGPRLQLFVEASAVRGLRDRLRRALPAEHRGFPTRWFSLASGAIDDHLEVDTLAGWLAARLPTITTTVPDSARWLATPQQHLLQLTQGEVFHDDTAELTALRQAHAWYPADVERWIIAAQWELLSSVDPLISRAREAGDLRGGQLLTVRAVQLVMEMAFLQERRYRPYGKWFGSAFARLDAADELGPMLDAALDPHDPGASRAALDRALLAIGRAHDALGICARVTPRITEFAVGIADAVRPHPVINSGEYIEATVAAIEDSALRDLPRIGTIDQLTHAEDLLINFTDGPATMERELRRRLGA